MRTLQCFLAVFVVIALTGFAFAQDNGVRDTLIFGDDGVVYSIVDKVRIPVYIWSDDYMQGFQGGIEYSSPTQVLTYDSASTQYSIFTEGYFDLAGILTNTDYIDGVMPDSLAIAGVALQHPAPPGRYKICDIWLDGAGIGDQITIDTCYIPPAVELVFSYHEYGQTRPEVVLGTFDIVQNPSLLYVTKPDMVTTPAGVETNFEVSATGYYPPITIYLDSLVRQDEDELPQNAPVTVGTNPLAIQWLSNPYEGNSNWIAYFTTVDALDYEEHFSVNIQVTGEGPYWGVIGDANCDQIVDIDDIVLLIEYVFSGGPAPQCE